MMSTTTPRTAVTVRIDPQHIEQLRHIADRNASTVSRTVARLVADQLNATQQTAAPSTNDNA